MTEEAAEQSAQARTLGLARWVQLAYMVLGLFLFWLLDKVITFAWDLAADFANELGDPRSTAVTAASAVIAAVVTWQLWKNEKINKATNEVIGELSRVTWPSRKETSASTVVVVITSIIAAAILGAFDAVWSTITDLIYKA